MRQLSGSTRSARPCGSHSITGGGAGAVGKPTMESMFDYMYGDMPADLAAQRDRAIEEAQ